MSRHRIFLLDAFALLYRSHFAFIKNPRITSTGLNTSAVFGFTNTLLEIIGKEDPTHLGVAFDPPGGTFRHKEYEPYKAQREAMPEDLRAMVPFAKRMLEVLDIPILEVENFEADDVIGTISQQADASKYDVYMVTPDKDYAQLVKENVFMYRPRFRGGGYDILGEAEVLEKFGIPPSQIIDFLGLKGDASDNIPGIPRVGDKTAVKLLLEYGSMEEIIANAENISGKALKATVAENAEQGLLSKRLATIHCEVPMEWSYDSLKLGHANLEELMPLMAELEFKTLTNRILSSKLNPVQAGQLDLFGGSSEGSVAAGDMLGQFSDEKNIENTDHQYHLVDTAEGRKDLASKIKAAKMVCFDTETTGLDPLQAELVGLSFALKPFEAYYVPTPADRAEADAILADFKEVLEDPSIKKIGQNLKYDMLMLRCYDVVVQGEVFDTMLAHYVVDANGKHGMDAMAKELLKYQTVSIETLIGKKGKKQLSMRDIEVEKVSEYAAEDADITLRLHDALEQKVTNSNVFNDIDSPLVNILTEMEWEGIRIDETFLNHYSEDLGKRLVILKDEIYKLAGEEFNINSPKQLGDILFEKLELGKGRKAKKTKTGQYQTNEEILKGLASSHELPAQILAYRGIKKLKSTYVDSLPKLINPRSGRVHTTYAQTVAVTGRLSSNDPNLQNIPIRTDDGREVRKAFVPRDENYVLMSADYSQVELRIMASLAKDEAMIEAFRAGEDIHRASAARVFGVDPQDVTGEQRSRAKTVNFGIIYGISAFGLSQRMGISRTEASDIIKTYFEKYPDVKKFMDGAVEKAKKKGYVQTIFGRRRYLPDIFSSNNTVRSFAERNAINSPIQGTAADIIKLAMIKVQKAIKDAGLKSRMLLQVHDELVFDAHKDEVEQLRKLVKTNMEGAAELDVPLVVEVGTGANWLEAH
ncbi:MAG: DNA polymerase I [Bacteroidia bacterium]